MAEVRPALHVPSNGDTRRWNRWSLRRTVTGLIAVVAVATFAGNAYSVWNAVQTRDLIQHKQAVINPSTTDVGILLADLLDQETGERGFVISGDPAALSPYTSGSAAVTTVIAQLRPLLRGQRTDSNQLEAVAALDRTWMHTIATPEIAATRAGDPSVSTALERSGTGRAIFDRIRAHMAALTDDLDTRSQTVSAAVLSATTRTIVLSVVRMWILLALLAGLWLLLNRLVSGPVERLDADVSVVTAGALDTPIPAHGPRELFVLGQSTEAMRKALRADADELRQLRQALAQRSPLHRLIRSELESSEEELDASIAGRLLPADGVLAGDWYDAWEIGPGRIILALVDVSGHGPEAGIMALRIKHLLRPPFRMGMDPGTAMGWVSDQLSDLDEQCATAIVLDIDLVGGRCRYVNAGHPSGMLFGRDGVRELDSTGPLLCGLPGLTWATRELVAGEGDTLVLVTDGLVEARLPDGTEFGLERIQSMIEELGRPIPPDVVAEALVDAVRQACASPLRDDATVVVTHFDPVSRAV